MNDKTRNGTEGANDSDEETYAAAKRMIANGDDRGWESLLALVKRGTRLWQPYSDLGAYTHRHGDFETAQYFVRQAAARNGSSGVDAAVLREAQAAAHAREADNWVAALANTDIGTLAPVLASFLQTNARDPVAITRLLEGLKGIWTEQGRTPTPRVTHQFVRMARLRNRAPAFEVFPPETLPTPSAVFFGTHAPAMPPTTFPAIRGYELDEAIIRPCSDTLVHKGEVVIPDFVDLEEHLLYDTWTGYFTPLPGEVACSLRDEPLVAQASRGIVLTSYSIINWAHFLTEALPLVAIAERLAIAPAIPLLVSAGIHPNMLAMIERMKHPQRPILFVTARTLIHSATVFSPLTTVPLDYVRNMVDEVPRFSENECRFSMAALATLRTRLHEVGLSNPARAPVRGRRLFLDRRSPARQIRNKLEVAAFFERLGYEIIAPETLTAEQQVAAFSDAVSIAGQTGAGMANMVFAPPGCRITTLVSNSPFAANWYYANLAGSLGHRLQQFAFAPIAGTHRNQVHLDFLVDLDLLEKHRDLLV